jgi:cell division septation protein DedD
LAPAGETAEFVAEAWNAPPGTILVQVSAVQNKASVVGEWQRLRGRFPEYLSPLRLVIDEAKLGDKGVFYRVQAGAFGSQAGASEVCDGLISRGQACFVVVR